MSSATIRNERCAVVLVEAKDEAMLLSWLAGSVRAVLGIETIGYGDKGSAVFSFDWHTRPGTELAIGGGEFTHALMISNTRGLLSVLSELSDFERRRPTGGHFQIITPSTIACVRLVLEDAIAGLAC